MANALCQGAAVLCGTGLANQGDQVNMTRVVPGKQNAGTRSSLSLLLSHVFYCITKGHQSSVDILVSFVNLTQARVIREEKASIGKMSASGWPVGKSETFS